MSVELRNELALANWQVARLSVDLATAQAENRRLRRMTTNGRLGRILHCAQADAQQLVAWRLAGYSISRRLCAGYGMSQRRWAWALALLRAAGVVGWPGGETDDFQVGDFEEALGKIEREAKRISEAGTLSKLEFRMHKWK